MRRLGRRRPKRDEGGIIVVPDVSAPPDVLPPSAAVAPPGDLSPIERIQAVGVRPGDVIVFKVPARNPEEFADLREQITALMDEEFPGHKVLVMAGDIEVSVMRPSEG